jgi:aryl-alcohol dehydrogenase-like predicted oxidoreductase
MPACENLAIDCRLARDLVEPELIGVKRARPKALGVDLPLSRLGLGAWAFGRTGWGAQHDRDSRAAILRAVELGFTWIDTAAVYGDGHSERLIGETLGALCDADRPQVFTKGGIRIDPASGATFRDLRPRSLRQECEASLRRLGVECIDLYQLHWPVDDAGVVERAWETLGELQDEGKIDRIGASNFGVSLLERCAGKRPPYAVQAPLSLLRRACARELLPWALEHGVRALAYSPLESGLLSGRFSRQRLQSLPNSDRRRERPQFQQPQLDRALKLLERLASIAAEHGMSLAQLAIAWVLSWSGVSGVIVGARTAEQVDSWAAASSMPPLEASALAEIEDALIATAAGAGPVHPYCLEGAQASDRSARHR